MLPSQCCGRHYEFVVSSYLKYLPIISIVANTDCLIQTFQQILLFDSNFQQILSTNPRTWQLAQTLNLIKIVGE